MPVNVMTFVQFKEVAISVALTANKNPVEIASHIKHGFIKIPCTDAFKFREKTLKLVFVSNQIYKLSQAVQTMAFIIYCNLIDPPLVYLFYMIDNVIILRPHHAW